MFRELYLKQDGKIFNAMEDGDLSCAFYVSSLLKIFNLIKDVHGTVSGTVKDIEDSGWIKVATPSPGDVLIWEADEKSELHKHIGFYVGKNIAISNSSTKKRVIKHNWTYGETRKFEAIYSDPGLE